MRSQLHSIFHNLLKNVESRNTVLSYFSKILANNEKRTQFHSEEKKLARDGFMLNTMTVLQKLSVKIKLERVDPKYPFQENALVEIKKDTKVRFDDTEFNKWISSPRKSMPSVSSHIERNPMMRFNLFFAVNTKNSDIDFNSEQPNFQTHCWFLTLHAHHLSIMPAIQRYNKRLRAIKEIRRMVDELQSTRKLWENSSHAARNKQLFDRFSQQLKKLNK